MPTYVYPLEPYLVLYVFMPGILWAGLFCPRKQGLTSSKFACCHNFILFFTFRLVLICLKGEKGLLLILWPETMFTPQVLLVHVVSRPKQTILLYCCNSLHLLHRFPLPLNAILTRSQKPTRYDTTPNIWWINTINKTFCSYLKVGRSAPLFSEAPYVGISRLIVSHPKHNSGGKWKRYGLTVQ